MEKQPPEPQNQEDKKNEETLLNKDLELNDDEDFNMPEEDMKNIINYINKLDYDKYAKDMEIREALQLIKNKMEREAHDKQESTQKVEGTNKVINETEKNKPEQNNEENQKHKDEVNDTTNNKEKTQTTIKVKPIIDENKVKREQEKQNFKVVEKIAKNEKLKSVHSIRSVKRLLESQGLTNPESQLDPLRITIIKEKVVKEQHQMENKLPFLHSLPLV